MKMGAMLVGKGFDTFCPLGPVIETDLDPNNVDVIARLNGELRQKANTSDLLFSVARLVSYISEAMVLLPGDVIMTGTPAGIGPHGSWGRYRDRGLRCRRSTESGRPRGLNMEGGAPARPRNHKVAGAVQRGAG